MAMDIRIGWRALWRAIAAGVIAAVVAGGVAFVVSQWLPKGYNAEAQVLVGSLTATTTDELDTYHRLAQTYAELATSSPVLERVVGRLGLSDDPARLATRIDVKATSQGIVVITTTAGTPTEASEISNTVADEVLRLATPIGKITSLAEVVQPASPPDRPASPNVLINTLIAAFLGLALGLGAALALASREVSTATAREMSSVAWPGNP